MSEKLIEQLAGLLQQQHDKMEEQRQEGIRREEKMEGLLQQALAMKTEGSQPGNKIPSNATPAPMLAHNASLREFTMWKQKFTDYISHSSSKVDVAFSKLPHNDGRRY